MQIIGAGLGRTGTASLKSALEQLGFGPCYHMFELMDHPEHAPHWLAAATGQLTDWDHVFAGYQSTVDWPGCTFWSQLAEAYPDAKILLNVRDPQRWYDSYRNVFGQQFRHTQPPPPEGVEAMRLIFAATFGSPMSPNAPGFRDHVIQAFERHNERVRQAVPRERLLEFQVEQGWEPLCDFLGVPTPQEPFPHLNDSDSFQKMAREGVRQHP
jgi:hypothetical protein